MPQVVFLPITLALVSLCIIFITYNRRSVSSFSAINKKLADLETILLDVRNGTSNYHSERRTSPRVTDYIVAKITGDEEDRFTDILNISYAGALLRTYKRYNQDSSIDMSIHLPLYTSPIHVTAKVAKVTQIQDTIKGSREFNVRIEFLEIYPEDKTKLVAAVDLISQKNQA